MSDSQAVNRQTGGEAAIAVIGAGVIGLSIAFRLAREHRGVVLVDRREPGREASFGNAGHIATEQIFPLASPATIRNAPALLFGKNRPLSIRREHALKILPWLTRFAWASRPRSFKRGTEALRSLQSAALDSLENLFGLAGISPLLHGRGHMIVVESKDSLPAVDAQRGLFDRHGIESEWLNPDDVKARAPELKPDITGALSLTGTGHVTNPYKVCKGLHDAFTGAGGRTLRADVRQIATDADGGFRLEMGLDTLTADKVIVAAGAWSSSLAAQLGSPVPLDTERGYSVTADGWRGRFDVSIASLERMTIMTPMDCGLRITGFVEFGGLDLPPRQRSLNRLKQHLRELVPEIDLRDAAEWMGFRPSLPDHLPVIGRAPAHPNAIFAFGHQHLGLTLAGVTADIVTALAADCDLPVDIRPFRPDRF